jgi:glucokinase
MRTERPIQTIFNYEDEENRVNFLQPFYVKLKVPESKNMDIYDDKPRLAISHSELGASKAIQIGAFAFALNKLNNTSTFDKIRQRKFQYFTGH